MQFKPSTSAAVLGLALATGSAQAALSSNVTLTIVNDAVTSYTASGTAYVSSDGPLLDSFFTLGNTSQTKDAVELQFAYLYNGASLSLDGTIQSNIAMFSLFGQAGSFKTLGTGISILSASGDTATLDISGWTVDWYDQTNVPAGGGAWSSGYTNGIGNLTCDAGSGCAPGSGYTLKYTATFPPGDAFSLGGVPLYLELHGEVGAVPEASTYAMMLAGLGLISIVARRRRV
jgi:hypothetical protein